jgi:hypothetical protein
MPLFSAVAVAVLQWLFVMIQMLALHADSTFCFGPPWKSFRVHETSWGVFTLALMQPGYVALIGDQGAKFKLYGFDRRSRGRAASRQLLHSPTLSAPARPFLPNRNHCFPSSATRTRWRRRRTAKARLAFWTYLAARQSQPPLLTHDSVA